KINIDILDSHLLMINDPEFIDRVGEIIASERRNVEWVLLQVIDEMVEKLKTSDNEYFKDRSYDFYDISKRILEHLYFSEKASLLNIKEKIVLVAHNLMPSDTISLDKKMVMGIVTDMGGKTSHTAIIARSFNIPSVLGLFNITQNIKNNDEIIVDGNNGKVIVNPDKKTREEYQVLHEKWVKYNILLQKDKTVPAKTKDGKIIYLDANIEVEDEIKSAIEYNVNGIGLFRTEFLYMNKEKLPEEEELFHTFKSVLEKMKNKTVVIRTIDIGGDKLLRGFTDNVEMNPILGWRAVRFCLSNPEILKVQLRALYRASIFGKLKIMFPFISGVEELDSLLEITKQVKDELRLNKILFNDNVPVGIMIEIPSAAITSDILAKKVDFFSIGTNDLIQYTVAVDRGNENIAYLYKSFHPGVLRLIKIVIDNAHKAGIPVAMCGEMAGDPLASVILLGMGLDIFSMSSIVLSSVKEIIRSVRLDEAEELVK
ncbi:MAG: phosphoenolpyruvate--protein phosphotransferase, partial [Spirochaetales bacterium]|nr:phosphoenolpyruvate--protein phosphotransferase [Spirochaetales bacterium]